MKVGPPCYGYVLKCHLVYFAIPGTRPLCKKKQHLCVYSYETPKLKFKSVQININRSRRAHRIRKMAK